MVRTENLDDGYVKEENMTLDLDRLSRKIGIVVRSLYSAALNNLSARIEEI
jgi:hypothetical protein